MITLFAATVLGLVVAATVTGRRNSTAMRSALDELRRSGRAAGRIPILMPVCGRPHYLRQLLAALAQVEGIDRALLVISQDGRNTEVSSLIEAVRFTETVVIRHTRPFLGIFAYFWDSLHAASVNIRFLLDFAFSGLAAPYAIVLEDDLIPSPDFLRYFSWAAGHLFSDERVLSVTGFNLHSRVDPEQGFDPRMRPYDLIENRQAGQPKFTGWSWAISGEQWRRIRGEWSYLSWDIGLDETQQKLVLISYKPALARVRNIGMQGGINFTESEENPKWKGLTIADELFPYDRPPVLLAADPLLPAFRDLPPEEPVPNERRRNRRRRLWLLAIAIAVVFGECVFMGWLK